MRSVSKVLRADSPMRIAAKKHAKRKRMMERIKARYRHEWHKGVTT